MLLEPSSSSLDSVNRNLKGLWIRFFATLVRDPKRGGRMSKDVLLKLIVATIKVILVIIQLLAALN